MILNREVSIVLIDSSYIPCLEQADLQEVVACALGLEGTWFEKLFERISVETLVESILENYVHYEDVLGLLKHVDLSRLLNPFQPYVDLFSHLALFLEVSSLRDRIVLCHDKLADILISLLKQRGLKVSKVDRALRVAMTEGAWISIHNKQAWSNVRIPDLESLPESVLKEALQVFNEIAKNEAQLQPLYDRYIYKSSLQKKIDRVALEMLGLDWTEQQLETLYDAIRFELDVMQAILEKSQKAREAVREESEEGSGEAPGTKKGKVSTLSKWMKG
jgi:hypothetical protein